MDILVIGLGSMGKRRIRLLQQIDKSLRIVGVDTKETRREEARRLFHIETESSLNAAVKRGCNCAFVCTSPLSHAVIIEKCLLQGVHVFTEINLVDDKYKSNIKLAKEKGVELFLSSTFLYREEIARIRQEVRKAHSILSYIYHVGQYLPDWHPWENYTEYFVGDTRTNGCRELMAIEFPWLLKTFGKFADIQIKKGKKTGMKTIYADSFLLLVEHETGIQGTIMVDVVSRKAVRNLEIYGEDLYLTWNGTADSLKKYNIQTKKEESICLYDSVNKQEGYADFVVENAYKNEINAFLKILAGEQKAEYGFKEDQYVLSVIDKIENTEMWGTI